MISRLAIQRGLPEYYLYPCLIVPAVYRWIVEGCLVFTFAISIWLLWVVLWQAHRHHLLAALLLEADAGAHRLPQRKGVNSSSAYI